MVGFAQNHLKPCLIVDLDHPDHNVIVDWIKAERIAVLNVAGSRGLKCPEAQEKTRTILLAVLSQLQGTAVAP